MAQVNWQVTATTVFCESIGEEATVMVYKDGTIKCTGHQKYGAAAKHKTRIKAACDGPACRVNIEYRERLFGENQEG